jgi:ribosomal protein S18 acetylase RimI-like enzyme
MIRIANRNDIHRIAEIELFVNRFNFKDILPNDMLYGKISYEYNKEWFTGSFDDMENNRGIEYYVLEDEDIIKGYFSISFPPDKSECELINLMIDVPFQGNKYGTALMDFLVEMVNNFGTKIIRLNVFEKNTSAIKFYEKYGFTIERKDFSTNWNINILRLYKNI